MCRAAAYVDTKGEVPLRLLAADIAHEIKAIIPFKLYALTLTFISHRAHLQAVLVASPFGNRAKI